MIGTSSGKQYETEYDMIVDQPITGTKLAADIPRNIGEMMLRSPTQTEQRPDPTPGIREDLYTLPQDPRVLPDINLLQEPYKGPKGIPRSKEGEVISDITPDAIKAGQQTAMMRQRPGLMQDPLSAEIEQHATGFSPGRGGGFSQLSRYKQNPIEEIGVKAYQDLVAPAKKPPTLSLERVGGESVTGGRGRNPYNSHEFLIKDKDGIPKAELLLTESRKGKELHVDWIGGKYGEGLTIAVNPNDLGSKAMRDVLRQLKDMFPNAENISGFRASGARQATGKGPADARLRLRPAAP